MDLFPPRSGSRLRTGGNPRGGDRAADLHHAGRDADPGGRRGRALGNAIVWLDTRAEAEAGIVSREAGADELYRRTGIADCNATCPISKLLWIKKHAPNLYTAASRFLLVEDYLILRLTGRFVSEKSVMSTTGYYDIYHDALWTELLEALASTPANSPKRSTVGRKRVRSCPRWPPSWVFRPARSL